MTKETPEENLPEKEEEEIPSTSVVELLQNNLKECQDKYLRLLAESENARKRMQKERHELTQFALENLLCEFLIPIDSLEKALSFAKNSSPEVKNWALGFEMIVAQFKQVLSNHQVKEFSAVGKLFDANFHEAVEVLESNDHRPNTIVEEFTKGYQMGDRVIRVARVKVAKAPTKD